MDKRLTFDGYDPHSPTLRESPIGGDCMGPDFAKWKTALIDSRAPIRSGDLVRLHLRYADGTVTRIIKELHCTREGQWYGRCFDGVFEIGVAGRPRTLVQPFFIERVVALSEEFYAPAPQVEKEADADQVAMHLRLCWHAVREWLQHGFPIGVAFPGLAADGLSS